MGVLVVAMIFGFIGFSLTEDILKTNVENTKMVMNVLKTFDALYDKFQSTSYHEAPTGIKNFDNLPKRTKWGYIRTMRSMRSEQFFKDITNDKTPISFTSIYTTLEVKFWALEYAFIFKLCHQYATTTKVPTGTLADDCLRMSNIMNVFGLENIEPIINRTKQLEGGYWEWRLREHLLNVYLKLASAMKTFLDQRNQSVHDARKYKEVTQKATNFIPNNGNRLIKTLITARNYQKILQFDDLAYLSITRNDSNIRTQQRIALMKIFFKWINCGGGYHTYLKINPKIPKLDALWPIWLTARSLNEQFAADDPDIRHPYCEYGPSNCNNMYRNNVANLIRTLKLNELRSVLNTLLTNNGSGKIGGTDLSAREQVIEKYVASIEFGIRFCYINLDEFRIQDYRYDMYLYDSLTKFYSNRRTINPSKVYVQCKESGIWDICPIWHDVQKSYDHFSKQMHFSPDDAILAIFTDPQLRKYFDEN